MQYHFYFLSLFFSLIISITGISQSGKTPCVFKLMCSFKSSANVFQQAGAISCDTLWISYAGRNLGIVKNSFKNGPYRWQDRTAKYSWAQIRAALYRRRNQEQSKAGYALSNRSAL